MRDLLKKSMRWVGVGWFWAVVLLVLPNCTFNPGGLGPGPNLSKGSSPHSSAIFCDIEKPLGRHCATAEELAIGIRLASAAVALNKGQTNPIGIDDSPAALARCGGRPEAVMFQGTFPEGFGVCLNCGDVIGPVYADTNAACVAQCEDFFGTTASDGSIIPDNPPDPSVVSFCTAHAHASTNFPLNGCFADACTTAGALLASFADPRRNPEPVVWRDVIGVSATGNTLTKTSASGAWDAGAASTQLITRGDAYVQFTASETDKARMGGLSSGAPPDTNPNYTNIGFGIDLFSNGVFSVFESGAFINMFTTYNIGDRFRVNVRDNSDGTATISYSKVTGPCTPGTACSETVFFTSPTHGAYPFRVDSSFFDQNATLTDVRLVRIQ